MNNSSSSEMLSNGRDYRDVLTVIDTLEVGPVILEKDRLKMPYTIINGTESVSTYLTYKYEETVFTPGNMEDLNLASMVGSQVALNYGLFCRNIVFRGYFSNKDKRFILDMMENTSREILVKKILEPNPFLLPEASGLNALKSTRYTVADIIFDNGGISDESVKWTHWDTQSEKHLILSSGGKDSLLSYGLIHEMGFETYPVFVNESGRHWYTALNAYRYFKENVSNTSRVWTNSDRLFNFMLRHLPFIRQDFANVRADEYPIRLWTVAVFLFGVLPVMKKRKIGRLVIGDEYDTTRKLNYRGITHYDGLYDQSRYFDQALSRYFMKKGWRISQFSLLRPLSEMLIEKILSERYPYLQRYQVSCHAAHIDGDIVKPCGKCEKCRRIVGMLLAFDGNPEMCGYSKQQVSSCISSLVQKGAHQESAGVSHLMHLLQKKNLIPEYEKKTSPRDEILKIRIDPERSSPSFIPVNLRGDFFRITALHASGFVRRTGRVWDNFNPSDNEIMSLPFSFEPLQNTVIASENSIRSRLSHEWKSMTWEEAETRLTNIDIAILPVGALEQHGPHLPLDVDAFDAEYLAVKVAEACSEPKPLTLPLIPYGVSHEHDDFKGTVSVSNDSLSSLVYDIGVSAAKNGIKKLVIINGHGGNGPALNYAAQKINRETGIFVCVDSGDTSDVDIYKLIETPNDIHAGEVETSTTLATRPDAVRINRYEKMIPEFSSRYLDYTSKRSVSWYSYTKKISNTGVLGDPTKASVEKGKKIWEMMIAHLVSLVEDLKSMTLEEIYQRRY